MASGSGHVAVASIRAENRRVELRAPGALESTPPLCVLEAVAFDIIKAAKLALYQKGTRLWVFAELAAWRKNAAGDKLFWLMGGAGTGKSVVSAVLLDRLGPGKIAAHHFCLFADPDSSAPLRILESIAAQLCVNLPGFKEQLVVAGGAEANGDVGAAVGGELKLGEAFDALLLRPLAAMAEAGVAGAAEDGGAVVIMIDALDELPRGGAVEAVLRLLADYFR